MEAIKRVGLIILSVAVGVILGGFVLSKFLLPKNVVATVEETSVEEETSIEEVKEEAPVTEVEIEETSTPVEEVEDLAQCVEREQIYDKTYSLRLRSDLLEIFGEYVKPLTLLDEYLFDEFYDGMWIDVELSTYIKDTNYYEATIYPASSVLSTYGSQFRKRAYIERDSSGEYTVTVKDIEDGEFPAREYLYDMAVDGNQGTDYNTPTWADTLGNHVGEVIIGANCQRREIYGSGLYGFAAKHSTPRNTVYIDDIDPVDHFRGESYFNLVIYDSITQTSTSEVLHIVFGLDFLNEYVGYSSERVKFFYEPYTNYFRPADFK